MERNKKIKIVIIVLAVLLGLSLSALGGTLLYNKTAKSAPAAVTVPDNLITPSGDAGKPASSQSGVQYGSSDIALSSAQASADKTQKAAAIELYNKQPQENTPFWVGNMLPGDSETKYFRVRVSYHDKITVHYKAAVRAGYEKLAEVLKVRVKLLTTGETMYDGLMRDMPEALTHQLASGQSAADELYYEITAYLDTSVGNEYQNKELIADFRWWAEETGNLDNSPKTGDTSSVMPWAVLTVCSLSIIIFLLAVRSRKEEEENG